MTSCDVRLQDTQASGGWPRLRSAAVDAGFPWRLSRVRLSHLQRPPVRQCHHRRHAWLAGQHMEREAENIAESITLPIMIAISRCVPGTSLSERFILVGVTNSVTKETLEKTKKTF